MPRGGRSFPFHSLVFPGFSCYFARFAVILPNRLWFSRRKLSIFSPKFVDIIALMCYSVTILRNQINQEIFTMTSSMFYAYYYFTMCA